MTDAPHIAAIAKHIWNHLADPLMPELTWAKTRTLVVYTLLAVVVALGVVTVATFLTKLGEHATDQIRHEP